MLDIQRLLKITRMNKNDSHVFVRYCGKLMGSKGSQISRSETARLPSLSNGHSSHVSPAALQVPYDGFIDNLMGALKEMKSIKLTLSVLEAMVILEQAFCVDMSLKELAKRLGMTTAAVTGIADRLQDLGYARRQSSDKDRRQIFMCLTSSGHQFIRSLHAKLASTGQHASVNRHTESDPTVRAAVVTKDSTSG